MNFLVINCVVLFHWIVVVACDDVVNNCEVAGLDEIDCCLLVLI